MSDETQVKKPESYINILLYQHDCVIVPGFGGFVANYKPASIHPAQHTFSPPSKKIGFNLNLKNNNDGLLTAFISSQEKISYKDASRFIASTVDSWNQGLNGSGKLNLEKIGSFFFNIEKNLCFEPDTSVNYLRESYGMTEVQSPPVKREGVIAQMKAVPKQKPTSLVGSKTKRINTIVWRAAAILIIAFGLGEITWLSFKTGVIDQNTISVSDLNPFSDSSWFRKQVSHKSESPTTEVSNTLPPGQWSVAPDTNAPVAEVSSEPSELPTEAKEQVNIPAEQIPEAITPPPVSDESGNYVVVAGCFQIPENADKLLAVLKSKGYRASITGKTKKGLTMVAYETFSSMDSARELLARVKAQEDSAAWLFHN